MSASDAQGRAAWTAAAIVLLLGYVVGLVVLGVAARPGENVSGVLAGWEDHRSWWAIAIQILLGLGAFGAYWWPRRAESRSFSVLVTAGLAVTTIALSFTSYWGCAPEQSAFWTPLTWSLNLIVGTVEDRCGYPLALQVARLFGPLLLIITAVGVLATVFRNQGDRLRVRFAPRLVVVVSPAADAKGLVRRLVARRGRRTAVAVLVQGAASGAIKELRDLGGAVVAVDHTDERALEVLLTARRRFKVHAGYLMSADAAVNLAWAAQIRGVAGGCSSWSSTLPPHLVVRIDDPWQAEYWRRSNAYRTRAAGSAGPPWVCDAVSVFEVTAGLVADSLQDGGHDRVALIGSSPLALAVCAELAQRAREDVLLSGSRRPTLTDLVLVGPNAARLGEEHALRQARFGNAVERVVTVDEPATLTALERVLASSARPAVLLTDDITTTTREERTERGPYLAARHPEWTILARSPHTQGVANEPIMERLYPFGLTTEPRPQGPVDSWERAARVVHERYRGQRDPDAPPSPAARAWTEGLDPFLQESNVRLVVATLSSVESLGRSWGPPSTAAGGDPPPDDISPEQYTRLAELEHESWRRHLLDNGWRGGVTRDDRRKTHPALRPWSELGARDRERALGNVTDAVATLGSLGYRSSPVTPPESRWLRFARAGEVTAVRTTEPWTWRARHGEVLQAQAGDWRVSDGGSVWSVAGPVFAATYEQVEGDRWRRIGEVDGRPAMSGEAVDTLEGREAAGDGDWLLRGSAGDVWVVSTEHLAAHYRRI